MPGLFLTGISSPTEPRPFQGPIKQEEMWCGSRNKWEGMKGMKGMGLLVSAMLLKEQLSKNSAKKKISKAVSNQKKAWSPV